MIEVTFIGWSNLPNRTTTIQLNAIAQRIETLIGDVLFEEFKGNIPEKAECGCEWEIER